MSQDTAWQRRRDLNPRGHEVVSDGQSTISLERRYVPIWTIVAAVIGAFGLVADVLASPMRNDLILFFCSVRQR